MFSGSHLTEHEFLFELLQELCTSLNIDEKRVNFTNIGYVDLSALSFLGDQVGSCDQVDAVTKGALLADLGQQFHGRLGHLNVLFLAPDI